MKGTALALVFCLAACQRDNSETTVLNAKVGELESRQSAIEDRLAAVERKMAQPIVPTPTYQLEGDPAGVHGYPTRAACEAAKAIIVAAREEENAKSRAMGVIVGGVIGAPLVCVPV